MKTRDFYFDLPDELIAQHPSPERTQSRLLVYSRKDRSTVHSHIRQLTDFLNPDMLLVFNNTRVRKARLIGTSDTGSQVEFLFLQPLDNELKGLPQDVPSSLWKVMVNKTKRQKPGRHYTLPGGLEGEIFAEDGSLRIVRLGRAIDEAYFARHGHVPLPPYIEREDEPDDDGRYQTVYAKNTGSVAAPTAGLHITEELLSRIDEMGIQRCELTLHVGLGTFLPVRTEDIENHSMHREEYHISDETAEKISSHKRVRKPVLAVGTTSVRTLESSWDGDRIVPGRSSTDIFIYPGYQFKVVDALLTNFHTPESTLLMLVSAFAGKDEVIRLYEEAVREKYRFFSYGDATLFL